MIIVLDIDETLITYDGSIVPRPGVREFLLFLKEHYTVAVWSYGTHEYVNHVLDEVVRPILEPVIVFSRINCVRKKKPLHSIASELGVPSHDLLLIDDCEGVTGNDDLNHLLIEPFTGDEDDVLFRLMEFLSENRHLNVQEMVLKWKRMNDSYDV